MRGGAGWEASDVSKEPDFQFKSECWLNDSNALLVIIIGLHVIPPLEPTLELGVISYLYVPSVFKLKVYLVSDRLVEITTITSSVLSRTETSNR